MTVDELEKLKIVHLELKLHPRKFYAPILGEVTIPEYYSIEDIFEMYYNDGIRVGKRLGAKEKVDEIKTVLNIN